MLRRYGLVCLVVTLLLVVSAIPGCAAVTVVSTFPQHHATGVDPGITSIKIRFSAPVSTGGWSFYNTGRGEPVEGIGDPVFEEGARVCKLSVALKPDTTYSFSINSDKAGNFRSAADGTMVPPYLVTFTTASSSGNAAVKSDPSELQVLSTFPANGATDVSPSTDKLRIRFSGPVAPGGWSLVTVDQGQEIETTGKPVIEDGNKLWIFPIQLDPGTTYAVSINHAQFNGFKSATNPEVAVAPYLLTFKTTGTPDPAAAQARKWQQDLAYLAKELPARHINLFAKIKKEQWDSAVADLSNRIGSMNQDEIITEMAKLVASVGDQHTRLDFAQPQYITQLPISAYWFKDGIFVVSAPEEYKAALGCRVDGIGTMEIAQASKALTALTAGTNDTEARLTVPLYLTFPQLLHALKVTPDTDKVPLRLTTPQGESMTLDVKPVRMHATVEMVPVLDPTKRPLYLAKQNYAHWAKYLDKENVVYFQYNKCITNDQDFFSATRTTVESLMKEHPDAPLVIDLRNNGGGDSSILDPFINSLKTSPCNRKGKLFVLTGRRTFSSAILNAMRLRNETKAVLIGEPTSGSPNHFGEVKSFGLPNSKMAVQYSTKYFKNTNADVPSVIPDVLVELTSKDYLSGTDPALDAVLKYKP